MKTRTTVGIAGFVLTLIVMIPILFFLTRDGVNRNQFVVIVSAVLLLVLWTIPYITLIDPLLRRAVGGLFNLTIEWRGVTNSISWTPLEETGCLLGLFLHLLGYFFIFLWLVPFAAAIVLFWWFVH
jgi:hypothetical protein